jgi:hypothetical protein
VGEVSTRDESRDRRSAAQIEADIARTRAQLAATLDELAVAVHPSTLVGQAKAQVMTSVDRTVGQAFVGLNRGVERLRGQFLDEKGQPRKERIIPLAAVAGAVVVGLVLVRRKK